MEKAFIDVYAAKLPNEQPCPSSVEHNGRREELLGIKNEAVLREKFFAWRLLEKALFVRFGKTPTEMKLARSPSGKWTSPFVFVSLSHTSGAVAAAISSSAVGVDIETEVAPRAKNFAQKTLTEREMLEFEILEERGRGARLAELWSMKEALFKAFGEGDFFPKNFDTEKSVISSKIALGEKNFLLSVASEVTELVKISVTELSEK